MSDSSSPTPLNQTSNSENNGSNYFIGFDWLHSVLVAVSALLFMAASLITCLWTKRYRSLTRTVQDLKLRQHLGTPSVLQADNASANNITVTFIKDESPKLDDFALSRQDTKSGQRSLWRPSQMITKQTVHLNRWDVSLLQLIKAGREGAFYKAKMTRSTCKGHTVVTCKVSRENVTHKQVQREISIMKKLGNHKSLLQLLDFDVTQAPYFLVMDFVSNGTLRNFLQLNQDSLSTDKDLQHLFTVAAYHIADAMDHLRNKMVIHCDLALRNIMVNSFPREVKVTEFGLARDLTRMRSRRSSRKRGDNERVPLRWYPPEYFNNKYYGFKSDVWSFGIVLWEMQTFGTLPYPDLDSSVDVVRHISAGHKNAEPAACRAEILQMMQDCWLVPYTCRPSFTDVVRVLEHILENDADYVHLDNQIIQG